MSFAAPYKAKSELDLPEMIATSAAATSTACYALLTNSDTSDISECSVTTVLNLKLTRPVHCKSNSLFRWP